MTIRLSVTLVPCLPRRMPSSPRQEMKTKTPKRFFDARNCSSIIPPSVFIPAQSHSPPSSVHPPISFSRHVARWTRSFLPRCVSRATCTMSIRAPTWRLLHVGSNIGPSAHQLSCLVTARVSECFLLCPHEHYYYTLLCSSAQQRHDAASYGC